MGWRSGPRKKPDGTVAGSSKRLVSRFYQLKTGHCFTGQYVPEPDKEPTHSCRTQTWDHLFKICPEWKAQQRILLAEV